MRHRRGKHQRVADEDFVTEVDWPAPAPEPNVEPVDRHRTGPLDNDEDAMYLQPDDPRRLEVERRRGWSFTKND